MVSNDREGLERPSLLVIRQKPSDLLFGIIGKHSASGIFVISIHRHPPLHLNSSVEQVVNCKVLPLHASQVELHRQDKHLRNSIVNPF